MGAGIDPTGATSSSAAINTLLSTHLGATFVAPDGATFTLTAPLVVPVIGYGTTLDLGTATLDQTVTGVDAITVYGNDVTIDGGTITGPQHASYSANERGINVVGTSAASPNTGFTLNGTTVTNFGGTGIALKYVNDFVITEPVVEHCYYAGITGLSCIDGEINDPQIAHIEANGVPDANAYGITFSSAETGNLTTDPRSENITVNRPIVTDIPTWTALDTHGGVNIQFLDIDVRRCYWGVGMGELDNASQEPTWPPTNFVVTGTVDSERTDDTITRYGVLVSGIESGGGTPDPSTLATGALDVTVKGHGSPAAGGGGVFLRSTSAVVATIRTEKCSQYGLVLTQDNYDFDVTVTAVDTWASTPATITAAVVAIKRNDGTLTSVTDSISGTFTAASLNTHGVYLLSDAGNTIDLVTQVSAAATPTLVLAPAVLT